MFECFLSRNSRKINVVISPHSSVHVDDECEAAVMPVSAAYDSPVNQKLLLFDEG